MLQYEAVYPIHINLQLNRIVLEELNGFDRLRFIESLGVIVFHNYMVHG